MRDSDYLWPGIEIVSVGRGHLFYGGSVDSIHVGLGGSVAMDVIGGDGDSLWF